MTTKKTITLVLALILSGCGTLWQTTLPKQTALEQMLVSTAVDRAANLLVMNSQGEVVANLGRSFGKTVIDAKNFNSSEVKNQQYALHAIRRNFIMRVWF